LLQVQIKTRFFLMSFPFSKSPSFACIDHGDYGVLFTDWNYAFGNAILRRHGKSG